ncbi:MAG: HNH endonuclease [Clostridium celatum]|nr:HNH endonuclease [Clostridium celatum]
MVLRAAQECRLPGCHELTREKNGYCIEHQKEMRSYKADKYDRFYRTKEWLNKRGYIVDRDMHLCIDCLINKEDPVEAKIVHHIEPVKDNWSRRLDNNNLISVCDSCHKKIEGRYAAGSFEKEHEKNRLINLLKVYIDKI